MPSYRPALHAFAIAWVCATFILIVAGGTVTSRGHGMAVPDWPTSYEYNMFLFPPSMWKGGIFWEHTHRLLGSFVGLLTIVMTVWLLATQKHRSWLRRLGIAALIMVGVQGIIGGLRVTELSIVLAVLHGVTAQLFLCVTVLITAATSKWWPAPSRPRLCTSPPALRAASIILFTAILIQLILGATMRHTGAGLAIPDFPASYGKPLPPMTQKTIDNRTAQMFDYDDPAMPQGVTPAMVGVHFAHRVWAVGVIVAAGWFVSRFARHGTTERLLARPTIALIVLLVVQVCLGALVIWSMRHPELATAHQATGAATLAVVALIMFRAHMLPVAPATEPARIGAPSPSLQGRD